MGDDMDVLSALDAMLEAEDVAAASPNSFELLDLAPPIPLGGWPFSRSDQEQVLSPSSMRRHGKKKLRFSAVYGSSILSIGPKINKFPPPDIIVVVYAIGMFTL